MSNYAVYFSPTKSTEKITKLIAGEIGTYNEIDLSLRNENNNVFEKHDVCIVGVPSYGGRVPAVALERMENFKGNNAKAILVVAYGNRHYDDTFAEFKNFLTEKGFRCIAAVAAVAEHSIMHQFAAGRPDENDKAQLIQFAQKIKKELSLNDAYKELIIPGKHPYQKYNGVPLKPIVTKKCNECGECAKQCPVGAIPEEAPNATDNDKCISCMRCINICPQNARKLNKLILTAATQKMKKSCSGRKENELFL